MNAEIRLISIANRDEIVPLLKQIYPQMADETMNHRINEIFSYPNYLCWGYFIDNKLLGICAGWITQRYYCGKQLEIDNFIIDENHRGQNIGEQLLKHIEDYSKSIECKTVELSSYVTANKAHKFYFRNGYRILGFHFEKEI